MSAGSIGNDGSRRFEDDELIPISALQHFVFCKRQAMLIHVEQVWAENRHTASGRVMHDRVHAVSTRMEDGRLVARGLRLASRRLGLSGIADVVEFRPVASDTIGVRLPSRRGMWQAFPVEYKRGRPKKHNADAVQLCAQAVCLEEMLNQTIPCGALFYGKTRRRKDVSFDAPLRSALTDLANEFRQLLNTGITPPPEPGPKCEHCSLQAQCLPHVPRAADNYIARMRRAALAEEPPHEGS